jgi:hypothetical protein
MPTFIAILLCREYRKAHENASMEFRVNGGYNSRVINGTTGIVCGKEGRDEKNALGCHHDLLRLCGPSLGVG